MAGWLELLQDLLRLIAHCFCLIVFNSGSHVFILHGDLVRSGQRVHFVQSCPIFKSYLKQSNSMVEWLKWLTHMGLLYWKIMVSCPLYHPILWTLELASGNMNLLVVTFSRCWLL